MRPQSLRFGVRSWCGLAIAACTACGPASFGETEVRRADPVQIQSRPAEIVVYDRASHRRFRVDQAARRCYEVYALLDHCPPGGDREACPRSFGAVRAANAAARSARTVGGCERDGCADVESNASCDEVRQLDESVASAMQF